MHYKKYTEEEDNILRTNFPEYLSLNGQTGPVTKKTLIQSLPGQNLGFNYMEIPIIKTKKRYKSCLFTTYNFR